VADQSTDPVVQQFREQISDMDLAILDALNKRLALVQKLHAYKRQQAYDVHDATRENWVLAYIARANRGPLSDEALRAFWPHLIDMTTSEAARLNAAPSEA
jgi:chorismate mutase/prephenate dehydratase